MLSFLFYLRGGGGVKDGLDAEDTCLGSLESNVSIYWSQLISLCRLRIDKSVVDIKWKLMLRS